MEESQPILKSIILDLPHTIQFLVLAVRDIHKSADTLSAKLGIGPWRIREFPDAECDDEIFGESYKYMYGSTQVGGIVLELEAPLSGDSPTAQFIDTHGEGIYAIGYVVQNLDDILSEFEDRSTRVIRSGRIEGCRFYTIELKPGFIIEVQEAQSGDVMIL